MDNTSQKGKILAYMQKHPTILIEAKDFMWICFMKPFIGYSASARLSELKRDWYIECVWNRKWLFNRVMRRNKLINLYKITNKGLNYKF